MHDEYDTPRNAAAARGSQSPIADLKRFRGALVCALGAD